MEDIDYTNPQSRNEKILAKIIGKYEGELEDPQSRIEVLLLELNDYIGQLIENSGGIPDWNVGDENGDGFIKNKPAIKTGKGNLSVIEGNAETASGEFSHAEGFSSKAEGSRSHAEGEFTNAKGISCHAEGNATKASGRGAHAEGEGSDASGQASHAEGFYTVATTSYSHVVGKGNKIDYSKKYVEIVGNGGGNVDRSNARTLDWSGNEWIAGKLTVGAAPTEDLDVTTKKYVDDLIADLQSKIDALTPADTSTERAD